MKLFSNFTRHHLITHTYFNELILNNILEQSLLTRSWSPESLRWLLVKGNTEEADKLYRRIARMNGKTLPAEGLEIDTVTDTQTRLGDFRDLFKTRSLTKTTLISWFCW